MAKKKTEMAACEHSLIIRESIKKIHMATVDALKIASEEGVKISSILLKMCLAYQETAKETCQKQAENASAKLKSVVDSFSKNAEEMICNVKKAVASRKAA